MKRTCITAVLLLLSSGSLATATDPLCVISSDEMPESWRPSAKVKEGLSAESWSAREAEDVQYAIKTGVDEMLEHFAKRPGAVTALWDDAVEALIDVTYSGGTGSAATD